MQRNKNRTLSLQKNFIFNLVYQILTLLLPLITSPYVSRILGPENIGIYSYTYAIVSTFMMAGALGIATHGQKEIASNRNDEEKCSELFWGIFLTRFLTVSITTIIFIIYALYDIKYSVFYMAQIPFLLSTVLDISWLFQGLERFDIIVFRNLFIKILGIILIFTLVKKTTDLIIYLLILSVSQLLGNMTAWIYLPGLIKRPMFTKTNIKYHLKETLVYFIPTIAYQVYAVLDRVMLGLLNGTEVQNGYYEQAYKIVGLLVSVYSAYNIVLRSRMAFYFSLKEKNAVRNQFNQSIQMVTFLSIAMSFGLCGIAAGFVPWFFGDGYEEVINLIYVFSPMVLIMGYSMCFGTHILTPGGFQGKANVAQCVAAIVNIVFNVLFIPLFAARGAAFASFLSQLSVLIIYTVYVKEYIEKEKMIKGIIRNVVAGTIMLAVLFYLGEKLDVALLSTVLEIFTGVIVYIIILILVKDKFVINILGLVVEKIRERN